MNRLARLAAALLVALGCLTAASGAASAAEEEQRFLSVLQSDKPAGEKAWACRELRRVGTVQAVPALAALLADKEISHSARFALERMPYPEAGAALRDALPKTAGAIKAGILDSIGERHDKEAVPALVPLVGDPDPLVASSAAVALGRIGGPQAIEALEAARPKAAPGARLAVADGLLGCADRLLAAGDKAGAGAIYKEFYEPKEPVHVRTAAYRGLILSAGDEAVALVRKALAGDDKASRFAALQMILEIPGEAATKAFAAAVAECPPQVQVAVIEALRQRGDAAAAPALVAAAASQSPEVRVAALKALSTLGDASTVPLLAEVAAKAKGAEQDAAREALARLRGPAARDAILEQLPKAKPDVQAELTRALGYRRDTAAVPALLKMADGADESLRAAALRSLAQLADEKAAGDLLKLLAQAKTEAEREAVEKALTAACGRSQHPEACAAPVLAAMKDAAVPVRCALLRVAGRIGGAEALKEVRAAVEDKDPTIQDVAIRTLADGTSLEAAPELLRLAAEAKNLPHRVLAMRGYWRLVGLAADRPVEERWKLCEAGLAASERPEEKKLGLTELAKVPHLSALKLAEALSQEPAARAEAEIAWIRIAASMGGVEGAGARLRRLAASSENPQVRAEAAKALGAMDQYVGYITAWAVTGPYRQQGKECSELFGIVFPPEQADAKGVTWKPLAPLADPSLSWQADLSNLVGGDHCVMYLRTRVYAPREGRVRLDIGTDDGIKLWVNGKLVHANNAIRGLKPCEDRAETPLKEGWNDFLLKITQHTMGCGACVRIRALDGSIIEGLRFDSGAPDAPKPAGGN